MSGDGRVEWSDDEAPDGDPLDVARGVLTGLLIGIVFGALVTAIWVTFQ